MEEGGEWVAELNEHFFSEVSRLTSPGLGLRSQDESCEAGSLAPACKVLRRAGESGALFGELARRHIHL